MSKFVKAVQGPNYSVIYIDSEGKKYLFSGGTWAWRNHNPGNMRPGSFSRKHGQIGVVHDQQKTLFAVFPDYDHGHAALKALLKTEKYQNQSLDNVIATYAPSIENNTAKYQEIVREKVQVSGTVILRDLSSEQFVKLIKAIEQIEGSREGKVEKVFEVQKIQLNKNDVISGYCCPPLGWLSKEEAVDLAIQGKINAIVCAPKKGSPYLRATPENTPLCELPVKKS